MDAVPASRADCVRRMRRGEEDKMDVVSEGRLTGPCALVASGADVIVVRGIGPEMDGGREPRRL